MTVISFLVQILIVSGSVYLLIKTKKAEAWLLTIGSSFNFLVSLFYTVVIQSNLIDLGSFPVDVLSGFSSFFHLLFGVGFLLTVTRFVKEREALAPSDFDKRY